MLETLKNNQLEYVKLSPEEMKERGILGRLVGTCADFIDSTRNGRRYSESLWEKVFASPLMKEKIKNKVCYGELNHPFDGRTEIDLEKAAVNLTEEPKKGKDGKLKAVFDILDTPNGRILNALAKYGSILGVSSRGDGETFVNRDGEEEVNEDTYNCTGFDIVPVPAVESARLQYVTESLNEKTLKQTLIEQLNNEVDLNHKKIMTETIKSLNIDLSNINESVNQQAFVANDAGTSVVSDLQEALKNNKELEQKVTALQEKLSVCYAKETKSEEIINGYKSAIMTLTESAKQVKVLQKRLQEKDEQIANNEKQIDTYREKYSTLKEGIKQSVKENTRLTESLKSNESEVEQLRDRISELSETIRINERNFELQSASLTEQLEEVKKDSSIKNSEYSDKLSEANSLVEKYKRIAQKSVDKYIESKAAMIGVSSIDIKSRLPESYSFRDIDNICEEMRRYKVNLNKLPVDLRAVQKKSAKVTISEAKQSIIDADADYLTESDIELLDTFTKK